MPAARRPKTQPVEQDAADLNPTPIPSPPPAMFVSTVYLQRLGVTTAAEMLDAAVVYRQINGQPWVTQSDLFAWAVEQWPEVSAVDRLNAAVQLLQRVGHVTSLG